MKSIVSAAKENGVTAIIAADHAVMNYAKKIGMEIHISTQDQMIHVNSTLITNPFTPDQMMSHY
jgi:putative protease